MVVRRHIQEQPHAASGRRCEGLRSRLGTPKGVLGCAKTSTSNRLPRRPVAATASGGASGGRRLNAETAQVAPLTADPRAALREAAKSEETGRRDARALYPSIHALGSGKGDLVGGI